MVPCNGLGRNDPPPEPEGQGGRVPTLWGELFPQGDVFLTGPIGPGGTGCSCESAHPACQPTLREGIVTVGMERRNGGGRRFALHRN